jgi:segregation and condensation protein B
LIFWRILSPERMSLKAKIEAVIYAAEEPVTLAALAGLFADEALEEKRAREAAAQVIEPANEVTVVLTTESIEPDDGVIPAEAVISDEHAAPLTVEEAAVMAAHDSGETVEAKPKPTAEGEKRAARQHDREVREELRRTVNELIADYANNDRGMEIREIAGGYRVGTKP